MKTRSIADEEGARLASLVEEKKSNVTFMDHSLNITVLPSVALSSAHVDRHRPSAEFCNSWPQPLRTVSTCCRCVV